MLKQMRKLPKWVALVGSFPLVISFAFWGISDIFKGHTDTTVATVGSTTIEQTLFSRDFTNIRRDATMRSSAQLSPAEVAELGKATLEHELSDTALDNVAARFGLTASDDQVATTIRNISAFRGPLGTFDQATFLQRIDRIGFTEATFVAEMRRELTRDQLLHAGSSAFVIPPGYVRAMFAYINERRAVQYVILPAEAAGPITPPPDAVLEAFIKQDPRRYSTPEYRALTYAAIGPQDLASQIQVTDAQLHQAYDLRRDTYVVPEKRDVQRINFPNEAAAVAARAKIASGTKFEEIGFEQGLNPSDINLGSLTAADLGAQGPVVFALPVNTVSQPVKGTFGWSLFQVTKIEPGSSKSFDDAKAELRSEIVQQLAASRIEDVVNAFEDTLNTGASLAEAAKKNGMRVIHVAATDAQGNAPNGTKADVPTAADFIKQVFSSDIGTETDPFESSDGNHYVISVEGSVPEKLKPLAAVRAQATADWIARQRVIKLAARAAELAKEVTDTGSLASIAAQFHVVIQSSDALSRDTPTPVFGQPILTAIFSAMPGHGVFGPTTNSEGFIVARVSGIVHPPQPLGDPRYQQFIQQLSEQIGSDIEEGMALDARGAQGVTINQPLVDRIVGGEGS